MGVRSFVCPLRYSPEAIENRRIRQIKTIAMVTEPVPITPESLAEDRKVLDALIKNWDEDTKKLERWERDGMARLVTQQSLK